MPRMGMAHRVGQCLANDLQNLQFGFRAQSVIGQAIVQFENDDAAPRELGDRVGQCLAQRSPIHGQTSAGDQLAHLALQLTQAAAQFLQRGEGLRRLAQLRLQPTRLIRQVTQLLSHRVVQLTGQGAVPGRSLFALLLTGVAAQAHGDADRLRRLFQQLAPACVDRLWGIEQQHPFARIVAVRQGTQQAMYAPLPARATGLSHIRQCRVTPRATRNVLTALEQSAPCRPQVFAAQDQIQFAGRQQCFETIQKTRQGTVTVHLAQGQSGQQFAHAACLFGANTPQPERPPLRSCSHH